MSSDGETILDAEGWSLLCEGQIRDQRTADEIAAALNARAALRALLAGLADAESTSLDPAMVQRALVALGLRS